MFGKVNKAITLNKLSVNTLNLANKKVVVVGGTDGLGRAIARLCESKGAEISVIGRTFREVDGTKIKFVKADLSLVSEAERVGNELPLDIDTLILTTGIIPAPKRQVSKDGIELDMAVSTLSRHVILKQWFARFGSTSSSSAPTIPSTKIFVMGFPGTNQNGPYDDLNSEKKYEGGIGSTHMLTVGGNEVLVHYYSKKGYKIFGLNPGLIKTNIRSNMYTGGFGKAMMEGLIGMFNITAEKYADYIVPTIFATDIDKHNGIHFNQKGLTLIPSTKMSDDTYVNGFYNAMDDLVKKAKQGK